jgi:hypothetical protein
MRDQARQLQRSVVITTSTVPLVAELVRARAHPDRRVEVGRRARLESERLGGIFPWLADLLAAMPSVASEGVALGLRGAASRATVGSFVESDVAGSQEEITVLREPATSSELARDVSIIRRTVSILRPLLGGSSAAVRLVLPVLGEQAALECSLDAEFAAREAWTLPGDVASLSTLRRHSGAAFEGAGSPSPRTTAAFAALTSTWVRLVLRRVIPPPLSWNNTWIAGQEVTLRSLAGTATADLRHVAIVEALIANDDDALHDALWSIVHTELGRPTDSRPVDSLTHAVFELIEPRSTRSGPISLVAALDAALTTASCPPTPSRATLCLIRQLAVFRNLADELGVAGRPFRDSDR